MQLVQDTLIFLARNMILCFGVVWLAVWHARKSALRLATGRTAWAAACFGGCGARRAVTVAGVLTLLTFSAIAAWYVSREGFADDVEPVVSSLSWQLETGKALYTSFDQAERYSVLYGPSVFLTNGLFLRLLGPSLVSVKVASALAGIGTLLLLYASLAGKRGDRLALAAAAGAVFYFWVQGVAIYLVRPDALIVFAVTCGIFAAVRTGKWLGIIAVAALAGFAINLKIHCFLYFLPVLIMLGQRWGPQAAVMSGGAALLFVAAPFAFHPQISAVNYLRWLANEAEHGFHLNLLYHPLQYALLLALPLLVVSWLRGPGRARLGAEKPVVLGLLPAVVAALVISAKPGSGIVHLLPLVPVVMYAAARLARPLVAEWRPVPVSAANAAAVAIVVTVLFAGVVPQYREIRLLDWQLAQVPGIVDDVREIMARYEGMTMSMGLGGEDRLYRYTWFKPLLTFHDYPVLLDPISVMDTVKSGKPLAGATYDAIAQGRVALWLVPRSQKPFSKSSWYDPDVDIFPRQFVDLFRACYELRGHSRYFDLWFWTGGDSRALTARP